MLTSAIALALALTSPSDWDRAAAVSVELADMGRVTLVLERFETLTSDVQASIGGPAPANMNALLNTVRSVRTYGGHVEGLPDSRAYMAFSPFGRVGMIEIAGRRFALAPDAGSWAGPVLGPGRWVESTGAGAPLLDHVCHVIQDSPNEGGTAGVPIPPASARGLRVRVAADCDFEFTSIFDSADSAAAYVVSLYGAISQIYVRECGVRVQLSYIRLWTTPDDPYQEPDPLVQFRNLWNAEQGAVVRDVAQLLTGRRNLPYGGVAWLSSACGTNGYSVCGYLIGSFTDPGRTDPGNWDIIVTAHELGHNIGTLHTHDYGIDTCASGTVLRGGFMSYCHTVSGATANVDLTMHTIVRNKVAEFLVAAPCITHDCDGDGVDDLEAIATNAVLDVNSDGIPDSCQDCDGDGILNPDAISAGSLDLNNNGIPDECEPDCNGNGLVDEFDIWAGSSTDVWGNGVPDECELDCDGNGTSDYTQILANMQLDLDRNGQLDSCQDCDGDGTLDATVLAGARHWWVSSADDGAIRELNARSGVRQRTSGAAAETVTELALDADGHIYGTSGSSVVRWDSSTGQFLGTFVAAGLGGLSQARGLAFLPDGSLLVASRGTSRVLQFSRAGAFLQVFALMPNGALARPHGIALRGDGVVAVSASDGRVHGFRSDGVYLGILADLLPLTPDPNPSGVLYVPSGDLLVASRGLNQIHRFDGQTGEHLGRFDVGPNAGSSVALKTPMSMKLLDGGRVVVVTSQTGTAALIGFDAVSGYHLRTYRVYSTDAPAAAGLLIMPSSPLDCNGNLIPDSCDLSSGFSADVNANGTPDECEGGPWHPADFNFDGMVDGADLGALLAAWGAGGPADLDGNGLVDGADLGILLGAWGQHG